MRKLLIPCLAILVLYFIGKRIYYSGSSNFLKSYNYESAEYKRLSAAYDKDNTHCGLTLFGDSHIQFGNWNELLGRTVCNRGIKGDVVEGLISRLGHASGDTVVIMAGINDIINHRPVKKIIAAYQKLLAGLANKQVYILQVQKVTSGYPDASRINRRVDELNAWLKQNGRFISCEVKNIGPDGIHFTTDGYQAIANALRPI